MDYPKFIVSNQKEKSISIQRVKNQSYTYFGIKMHLFLYYHM